MDSASSATTFTVRVHVPSRAVVIEGSLAMPLVAVAELIAGLRATYTRWAEWLVGLNDILLYAGIVALVGAVLAAVLTRPGDFYAHGTEPAAAEPVAA